MTTPPSRFITERRLPGTSRHLTNRVYRDQHKFIAPVRDCLTSCLRALIYFPLTVAARSNSVYLPQPCPPFFCSSHTYMHAWGGGGTQRTADLSGHVRSSAVLQGLLPGPHLCSYNGMLTHLALLLSTRGLWEQTHFFFLRTRRTHTSAKDKTIPRLINKFLGNNKNNFNVFTDRGSVKAFFFFFPLTESADSFPP